MIIILCGGLIGRGEGGASNWWLSVIGGIRCKAFNSGSVTVTVKKPNFQITFEFGNPFGLVA